MKSKCPTGCGRVVDTTRFVMCGTCWREVPRHLQTEVYAAWRAVLREPSPENIARHQEAKDAAIGSVP